MRLTPARTRATACHLPEIHEGLFLGNITAAQDPEWLREYSIDTIINVTTSSSRGPHNIEYLQCAIEDRSEVNLRKRCDEVVAALGARLDAGKRVLVHCTAGRSRYVCGLWEEYSLFPSVFIPSPLYVPTTLYLSSPSVVMMYAMRFKRFSLKVAFDMVNGGRHGKVEPNWGFQEQLTAFEREAFSVGENSKLDWIGAVSGKSVSRPRTRQQQGKRAVHTSSGGGGATVHVKKRKKAVTRSSVGSGGSTTKIAVESAAKSELTRTDRVHLNGLFADKSRGEFKVVQHNGEGGSGGIVAQGILPSGAGVELRQNHLSTHLHLLKDPAIAAYFDGAELRDKQLVLQLDVGSKVMSHSSESYIFCGSFCHADKAEPHRFILIPSAKDFTAVKYVQEDFIDVAATMAREKGGGKLPPRDYSAKAFAYFRCKQRIRIERAQPSSKPTYGKFRI